MKTITLLLFTVIFNGCGSGKSVTNFTDTNKNIAQENLDGTFMISEIDASKISENLTINFDSKTNRISGFSGCNNFFGTYSINGNSITFEGIGATEKMCLGKESDVETKMMKALGETTSFEISNNNIMLFNAGKKKLTASKSTEAKMTQENIKIEYRTHTRGSFKKIILDNKTLSVQDTYDGKPNVKDCTTEDWNAIEKIVSEINLKALTTLTAPSKAHQYDGAALANFTVTKDGETYEVPVFDAGNPNKEIEPLVNLVVKIAKATNEKN